MHYSGHSWDFSDDRVNPPVLEADEIMSATELSPTGSDESVGKIASDGENLQSTSDSILSPAANTIQKKKGRFVVDVPVSQDASSTAAGYQSSPNHSRQTSAGLQQQQQLPQPVAATAAEVKKGRFSVIGEKDPSTTEPEKEIPEGMFGPRRVPL